MFHTQPCGSDVRHCFPGLKKGELEEEEEGQPSLEQTATSVAAGEEEKGELGEVTLPPLTNPPPQQVLHRQSRKEVRERNVV